MMLSNVCRSFLVAAILVSVPIAIPAEEKPGSPIIATFARMTHEALGTDLLWSEVVIRDGWRIERNVHTGRYRLRNPKNHRLAIGDLETCRSKLDELCPPAEAGSHARPVVILLHGLARSRTSMEPLAEYLADTGRFEVVNFGYPSTRGTVAEHAASLGEILAQLEQEGVEEVHFVAHSLGNLVLRHYLARQPQSANHMRVGRIVMLGPPNQGARMAKVLANFGLFHFMMGPCGQQLGATWDACGSELCTPAVEFGILAGKTPWSNPLIPGDDDLIVGTHETRLTGAADFRLLPLSHAGVRRDPLAAELILHFLIHGRFGSEAERQRIDP
jgi:pimeloyl-ACP methyl ester carboxylesterase